MTPVELYAVLCGVLCVVSFGGGFYLGHRGFAHTVPAAIATEVNIIKADIQALKAKLP